MVGEGGLLSPLGVFRDEPSRLKTALRQADYVMVAHERLKKALEPLAAFHRARGLKVAVVDIQDVYDEFNHGILHPRALRDFLSYAYHKWKRPAPRYVLLVGDASLGREERAGGRGALPGGDLLARPRHRSSRASTSIPYANDAKLNHRNLVPTWSYLTYDGHAAGDNYFVSVDGDDDLPDMAIGRFTAVNADEVTAIVEKTIRYAKDEDEWGPWRRRMLLITSEQLGFQYMSNGAGRRHRRRWASRPRRSTRWPSRPARRTRRGSARGSTRATCSSTSWATAAATSGGPARPTGRSTATSSTSTTSTC